jgi:hypothetical protein
MSMSFTNDPDGCATEIIAASAHSSSTAASVVGPTVVSLVVASVVSLVVASVVVSGVESASSRGVGSMIMMMMMIWREGKEKSEFQKKRRAVSKVEKG